MVATGWILYQHYTAHTPTPLEYKWDLGPEECPGMASPEDIDSIYKIWYAQTAIALTAKWFWNTLQASLKTKFTWGVLLKVDLSVQTDCEQFSLQIWQMEGRENVSNVFKSLLTLIANPDHPPPSLASHDGENRTTRFHPLIKFLLFCVEI